MTHHPTLRHQLQAKDITVAPGIFDAFGATLVEQAGFHSTYLSGASVCLYTIWQAGYRSGWHVGSCRYAVDHFRTHRSAHCRRC